MSAPGSPLADVRVVDLSQNLAGPYATQVLADLGADVIKVEPPGGDPARAWGPPFVDGESPLFLCANRNKRSIVLDLTTAAGREAVRRLAGGADVFVTAFRAGVAARLGVDRETVGRWNPRAVYLSVTAFGDDGPLRDQPGYDPLMQAYAGLMSVTGQPGGPPARAGTSVVDLGAGLWAAVAVLAALRERDAAGPEAPGGHVTTSLLDASVAWMAYHLQGHLATGLVPGPMGSALGMIAPYEAFPTADGHLMIAAGNDATFRRLCGTLGLDALADDPRFATNPDRVAHRDAVVGAVADATRELTTRALESRLRDASVPCAPIHDVGEVAADEQVRASGMLRDGGTPDRPDRPEWVDVAAPFRMDGARPPLRRPPPGVGEHTGEILREIGLEEGPH